MVDLDDVLFVVRSVGERTEAVCIRAIGESGAPRENIKVIRKTPFSETLRHAYRAGLESGKAWTFCIDADVVLRANAVGELLMAASKMADSMLGLQGLILDKFTCSIRAGGVHLYRSRYLGKAMDAIPDEGASIRPETSVLHALRAEGHNWQTVPYLSGIHDFGQSYEDIFRKCYVHANKHVLQIPRLLPLWRRLSLNDPDFIVAIAGLAEGIRTSDTIYVDKRNEAIALAWQKAAFEESSLCASGDEFSSVAIENCLQNWGGEDTEIHGITASREQMVAATHEFSMSLVARISRKFAFEAVKRGNLGALLSILGQAASLAGARLQRLSDDRSAGKSESTSQR